MFKTAMFRDMQNGGRASHLEAWCQHGANENCIGIAERRDQQPCMVIYGSQCQSIHLINSCLLICTRIYKESERYGYICIYIYIYKCIYLYIERERSYVEIWCDPDLCIVLSKSCIYIYICMSTLFAFLYIYMYIYIFFF